jgi:hypothetical protein
LREELTQAGIGERLQLAAFSFSITSAGVPRGAEKPCQTAMCNPGTPASSTVGMSGADGSRLFDITAEARIAPEQMCGSASDDLLPEVIAELQKTHPAVRVEFGLGTSAEVMQAIRAHQAEIGGGRRLCRRAGDRGRALHRRRAGDRRRAGNQTAPAHARRFGIDAVDFREEGSATRQSSSPSPAGMALPR